MTAIKTSPPVRTDSRALVNATGAESRTAKALVNRTASPIDGRGIVNRTASSGSERVTRVATDMATLANRTAKALVNRTAGGDSFEPTRPGA
ncbi:MAG TPA: hypothetical protein VK447_07150 [Myxococcaceae bacterium]|nr:hypothetical protein [Myxococcaceae bacterium]